MSFQQIATVIPVIIAFCLAMLLFFPLWRKPKQPGSMYGMILLGAASLWITGAAMHAHSPSPASALFWQEIEYTGSFLLPLACMLYTLRFNGNSRWLGLRNYLIYALPAVLTLLLLWTNSWHNLFWDSTLPVQTTPHQGFGTYTLAFWLALAVNQLYLLATVILLLRLRLLNLTPVAVDSVVDAMGNGMLVVSKQNDILYMNQAAMQILGLVDQENDGKPVAQVLTHYPLLRDKIIHSNLDHQEVIVLEREKDAAHFEVTLTALNDRRKKPIGKMIMFSDVTHRVQAEIESREAQEKLRRSEETYRQLVENINEIFYVTDCQGMVTFISPSVERTTGFAPRDLIYQPLATFLQMEDLERLKTIFTQTLSGEKESFEVRLKDKSGSVRTFLARQQRLEQENSIVGVQGMLSDITERLQVEEALERRASQLAILNDIGEKIAALTDLDSVLDRATSLIQSNFGYYHVAIFLPDAGKKELLMRSSVGAFTAYFPENHRLKFGQGMVGWVAENSSMLLSSDVRKEPHYTNLYPDKIITRSELTVPILLGDELVGVLDIQSPVYHAFDDNDVRVIKTIADQIAIALGNAHLYEEVRNQLKETERKENMLRIQRDLVVAISAETSPQQMLNTAIKTLTIELNVPRAAVLLLDVASGCLLPAAMLGFPEGIAERPLSLDTGVVGWVTRTGQPALISDVHRVPYYLDIPTSTRSELCTPLLSGGEVIGVINLESPVANAFTVDDLRLLTILSNNLVVLIERARLFQEIEKARAELEKRASALESANERLRELDRLKSQFLANMSHELRTPLNSIIGFSEILIDNLAGPLNHDQGECVQDIHDSGRHLLALINDLLDFSKIEAGKLVLEPTTFIVAGLLDELRTTILPLAERKAQLLTFQVADDLTHITADRLRLKQVFINLLSNANKFTPAGGRITVGCRQDGADRLLFCFQDTGIGIRPEHQELIFEEFRQVDGSMTREAAGTGLGLAISKRIVHLHHGAIWVESEIGQGSAFYVSLPVAYQPDMI